LSTPLQLQLQSKTHCQHAKTNEGRLPPVKMHNTKNVYICQSTDIIQPRITLGSSTNKISAPLVIKYHRMTNSKYRGYKFSLKCVQIHIIKEE